MQPIRFYLILTGVLLVGELTAQVPVKNQPPAGWCSDIRAQVRKKAPAVPALLALKATAPTADLQKALTSSDWIIIGDYSYPEQKVNPYYGVSSEQMDFHRFAADGGMLSFSCYIFKDGKEKTTHINFTAPDTTWNVKKIGTAYYIEEIAHGEKAYFPIIQFKDNILVVDISQFGKIGEKIDFRSVLIAVPRAFTWELGEKPDK
jgi:hypothetical protein